MVQHYTTKDHKGMKDLGKYLNDVQEELMDAILYIQAAREEIAEYKHLLKNIERL